MGNIKRSSSLRNKSKQKYDIRVTKGRDLIDKKL